MGRTWAHAAQDDRVYGPIFRSLGHLLDLLPSYLKFLDAAPARLGLGCFMSPLVKFCLVSVLPFGVLAYSDKTWRSSDAASVICGAWGVVYMGLSVQYKELCPMGLLIALIPFILT